MNEDDLTARARIRDAALLEFGEHGVKGATIRGIAQRAGVSPGLVQHHFGTKDGLREACDRYTIDAIRVTKRDAIEKGVNEPGLLASVLNVTLPIQRYVARALVDGSPAAAALFDDTVKASTELLGQGLTGMKRPTTSDLEAYSAAVTAMTFGLVVLHEHLGRVLGEDPLTVAGYPRLALAVLDVFADDLLSPELVDRSRAAIRQFAPETRS